MEEAKTRLEGEVEVGGFLHLALGLRAGDVHTPVSLTRSRLFVIITGGPPAACRGQGAVGGGETAAGERQGGAGGGQGGGA